MVNTVILLTLYVLLSVLFLDSIPGHKVILIALIFLINVNLKLKSGINYILAVLLGLLALVFKIFGLFEVSDNLIVVSFLLVFVGFMVEVYYRLLR